MNKKKNIIILLALVLLVWFLVSRDNQEIILENQINEEENISSETEESEQISEEEQDQVLDSSEESFGKYTVFSEATLASLENKDIVLFFKASWCPSCRILDANLKSELESIPESLVILEVDYDNSEDLKKKYDIRTQHTLVQVDSNGNLINKWSGGSSLDSIIQRLQ